MAQQVHPEIALTVPRAGAVAFALGFSAVMAYAFYLQFSIWHLF